MRSQQQGSHHSFRPSYLNPQLQSHRLACSQPTAARPHNPGSARVLKTKMNGLHHTDTELVLASIRCLAADLVQAYKGGHAGTPMGAAAIGVSLWRDAMVYNPADPLWFGRDRFVLSAGHACLFQYIMLHLTGYPVWTMQELKRYHSRDFATSRAAGHPEIEQEVGIEITTGPLGQGIANSVGLAIAQKQLASRYTRPGFETLFQQTIWCFSGDGCLQEGIGQEAVSMAGHLGLDNLVLIYDENKVTVDGRIENCFTEDVPLRFQAANWNVIQVTDITQSPAEDQVQAVTAALQQAKQSRGQPSIVIIPTIIGFGSRKANTGPAHGQALGDEEVAYVKRAFGMDVTQKCAVSEQVYQHFEHAKIRGSGWQATWESLLVEYGEQFPQEHAELSRRIEGKLPSGWRNRLPSKEDLPTAPQPTRKSSGIFMETFGPSVPDIVAGSADLLESTFVSWKGMVELQKPGSGLGDHSGRQVRYGIREHSMAGIANGMAAYFPNTQSREGGGILPIYSTFFMFTGYALPAIRMAALQNLRTVTIATHDSIGIGEDGPTHQPIALAAFFRALPGLRLWRPADAEETMAAWIDAAGEGVGPSILCLSRQPLPLLERSCRDKARRGAYVVHHSDRACELVLIATGSEVYKAIEVAKVLAASPYGHPTRVVSMPNQGTYDKQTLEYKRQTIPSHKALTIALEAWTSYGWAKYAHASLSMSTFGHSGPQADLFEHFGFGINNIVKVISNYLREVTAAKELPSTGDFRDLLEGFVSHVSHY